jgi:hypothetical protein
MKYHCGLLSERPEKDATLQWVRKGWWDLPGHPPEIEFERRVWLAMPGFSASFHAHTLGVSIEQVTRHLGRDYDELRDAVAENWLSCTRDDAVKLSQLRPPKGELPLLCQLQIMRDLKAGLGPTEIAQLYLTNTSKVCELGRGTVRVRRPLPSGFELLTA